MKKKNKYIMLCPICWEEECNCDASKVEIDVEIAETIKLLNKKGYHTTFCCGGHIQKELLPLGVTPSIYVAFNKWQCKKIDPQEIGEGWTFTPSTYTLRYTLDWCKKFKIFTGETKALIKKYNHPVLDSDIELIKKELEEKRKELYEWIKSK